MQRRRVGGHAYGALGVRRYAGPWEAGGRRGAALRWHGANGRRRHRLRSRFAKLRYGAAPLASGLCCEVFGLPSRTRAIGGIYRG